MANHPNAKRGLALWNRRRNVARFHGEGFAVGQIAAILELPRTTVSRDLRRAGLAPRRQPTSLTFANPLHGLLYQALKSLGCLSSTDEVRLELVGNPLLPAAAHPIRQALHALVFRKLAVCLQIHNRSLVNYWRRSDSLPIELPEAQEMLRRGATFADVLALTAPAAEAELREWYVRTDGVPNREARKAEPLRYGPFRAVPGSYVGYTGDVCSHCQGVRMVRTGPCQRCEDCGDSTSCG